VAGPLRFYTGFPTPRRSYSIDPIILLHLEEGHGVRMPSAANSRIVPGFGIMNASFKNRWTAEAPKMRLLLRRGLRSLAPEKRKPKHHSKSQKKLEKTNSKSLLHLKNDVIFKMVFGDERNKHILKAFLLAVLDLPEDEYDVLEIMDPYLRADRPDEKLGILDVYIRTKTGKRLDVEIQVARTPFFRERVAGYAGKILGTQLFAGNGYIEMKKVINVVILDYNLIEDSDSFHNQYMLYDAKTKSLLTDIIEIHTLEMQKLQKDLETMPDTDEKTRQQILWLKFIRAEEEEEVKMLAVKIPEIQEAYGVLQRLSEDERVRLLYESREKALIDEQARLYGARKEGKEEGIVEGRAEGKAETQIETARRFLAMGVSVEMVAQGTGLTEKEVRDLQNAADVPIPARKRGRPHKNPMPA
jgi:predicted transposase/invertase (TIGR01784 family)